jgi:NAD-dependent dihydropyrimidine dehydrogenase PreA subunit
MREMLDTFSQGRGNKQDLDDLMGLAEAIQDGSLCALGGSAPNPVLTTVKYFKDEYLVHIEQQRCPAGVCKDLITYHIDSEKCTGCMVCARNCPQKCISGERKNPHQIEAETCIRCGICMDSCKFEAVQVS